MPKINQKEYEVLKSYISEEKYIAKDRDGSIRLLTDYPERDMKREEWSDGWGKSTLKNSANNFKFIQWEDEEPYNIAELIEEYESSQMTYFDRKLISEYERLTKESEETEAKDMKWFKKKLDDIEVNTTSLQNHDAIWMLNRVHELYDQLDEPEVLSQELPVIPKFVAEWISAIKPDNSLRVAFEYIAQRKKDYYDDELAFWVEEGNSEAFARAWLDGFTVEEEQKYYVINDENELILGWSQSAYMTPCIEGFEYMVHHGRQNLFQLTEQEIKEYDERYWPFAVPVEELEE